MMWFRLSLFSFLMMLGDNSFIHPLFYKFMPGFSTLRFPSVWRCVVVVFTLLSVSELWSNVLSEKDGKIKKVFADDLFEKIIPYAKADNMQQKIMLYMLKNRRIFGRNSLLS